MRAEEEFDTIEEVEAVFRALRRLNIMYGAALLGLLLAIPVLTYYATWWVSYTLHGGFTPNFLTVSVLTYFLFWLIAYLYTSRANRLEEQMLGKHDRIREGEDGP